MSFSGDTDDLSTASLGSHKSRPRNEKIKAIAIRSAEKDVEIARLKETIRKLEVDNAILQSKLADAQQTVYHLAGGSFRPALAEAPSVPGPAHSSSDRSVVATSSHGLNAAAGAWHHPQEGRPSVLLRLGNPAGHSPNRGRGTRPGNSPPPSQERRASSGRGQGSSPSAPEQASQDRSARSPHGRGNPRGGAQRC